MSQADVTIGMRLDADQLGRLDGYAERLSRQTGLDVTRAAAARSLLIAGLDLADQAPALLARVDRFAARMEKVISRPAAIAQLLEFAVDTDEKELRKRANEQRKK
jgi:hypothetical protein